MHIAQLQEELLHKPEESQEETPVINIEIPSSSNSIFNNKKIILVMIAALSVLSGSFGSYVAYNKFIKKTSAIDDIKSANSFILPTLQIEESTPSPTPTPTIDPYTQNPFNGKPMLKEDLQKITSRPLAVMIDNSRPARVVQQNVNRADIVYEGLVEGGITRFMGIFYSDQSNFRVMPVRSIRNLFLDNFVEYNDAMIYHVGGADTPEEPRTDAVNRILKEKIKSIYFYKGNNYQVFNEEYDPKCIENPGIPGYSCKFHYTDTLRQRAVSSGYESTKWEPENKFEWSWKFDKDQYTKSDLKASNISYKFTAIPNYNVTWKYDASSNKYLRENAGVKQIDNASKEQLFTDTLITQSIKYKLNVDDKGGVISTTTGEGDAIIFMDGQALEVTWKKDCTNCRTRYFKKDSNGVENEVIFKPGKIWVSITRTEEKVTYSK